VGECGAAAGWSIVAEVIAGWFAKLVHGVVQPGGQCLQLHDGLITEGSYFWLWNCSKGNTRRRDKVIFMRPRYIAFMALHIK